MLYHAERDELWISIILHTISLSPVELRQGRATRQVDYIIGLVGLFVGIQPKGRIDTATQRSGCRRKDVCENIWFLHPNFITSRISCQVDVTAEGENHPGHISLGRPQDV